MGGAQHVDIEDRYEPQKEQHDRGRRGSQGDALSLSQNGLLLHELVQPNQGKDAAGYTAKQKCYDGIHDE